MPLLQHSFGEGNGKALQYACLENPMDGETLQATFHGVTKSWTPLSDFTQSQLQLKTFISSHEINYLFQSR